MLFLFFFLCLSVMSVISLYMNKRYEKTSLIVFFFLFLFSSFRYSLGSDYFSYAYIYEVMPYNILKATTSGIHSEVGFKFLIVLCKNLGIGYPFFLSLVSLLVLFLFGKVIVKESKYPLVSIQIFYSTYYLIYLNSSIRQAIAMGIVFYSFHQFYLRNRHKEFIGSVIIATSIHVTALFILLIYISMFFYKEIIIEKKYKIIKLSLIVYSLTVIILNVTDIPYFIFITIFNIRRLETYFTSNISLLSLFSKLLFFIIISLIYFYNKKNNTETIKKYYIVYVTGMLVYFLSMSAPISSRILEYFTMFEVMLIPWVIFYKKINRQKMNVYGIITFLLLILLVKDLNSFTYQENYVKKGMMNYRYFTIFNKEKIHEYKEIDIYLKILNEMQR